MWRHDTDRAIVAAKDKFDRSQNGTLDQGVKSTQHYGKELCKASIIGTNSQLCELRIDYLIEDE